MAVNTLLMAAYAMAELDDKKGASNDLSVDERHEASFDPVTHRHASGPTSTSDEASSGHDPMPSYRTALPISVVSSAKDHEKDASAPTPRREQMERNPSETQKPLAEVSPDHADKKTSRKRSLSSVETDAACVPYGEQRRRPSANEWEDDDPVSKMDLFRRDKVHSSEYPPPERNVSADSDDAVNQHDKLLRSEPRPSPLLDAASVRSL